MAVWRTPRISSVCLTALLACALVTGSGCSSDSGSDDSNDGADGADDGADGADDGADGADDGADDGSPGDGTHTVEWGPLMAMPGFEDTRCVTKRLPTDRPIRVGQIENELGLASHHMIVYRVTGDPENAEPEPCDPFVDVLDPTRGAPLAVTQKAEETIALPPGVAFTLEPGQLIRVELHFINATDEPQELRASTTFVELPEDEFEQEADFLFVGNPDINLPAYQGEGPPETITLGPTFLPLPQELDGVNIFAITGHQHQWGVDVQVSRAANEGDEGEPIYALENFEWDEPETIYHDPPLAMAAGTGFRFTCSWQSFSEAEVGFGESVNDEMCFFWAYYYPSRGAKICAHTDQFQGGIDVCCPSEKDAVICSLIDDFLDNQ
jgi:Copper type II ascorbate-dependent monooxygenase, C-terminal domain